MNYLCPAAGCLN